MADVDEFLYVRASDDADAEIIGKLYKGDVADVVESGDTWTHVVSGDVDGYVNNDYCVSGEDALAYAQEKLKQRHRSIRMDFVSEMKRPRMRPLSLQFPKERH